MDIASINSDIIRGNVTTIILKTLAEYDRYGYDILKEIEDKTEGQYKIKQPTLYSCLKRLEKQGFISSYWGTLTDTSGGRRRYYALTNKGAEYLNKNQMEYEYSRTILDRLLSDREYDLLNEKAPYEINDLRPFTKRNSGNEQIDAVIEETVEEKIAPITLEQPQNAVPKCLHIIKESAPVSKNTYEINIDNYSNAIVDSIMASKKSKEQEKVEIKPEPVTPTLLIKKEPIKQVVPDTELLVKREQASKALGIGKFSNYGAMRTNSGVKSDESNNDDSSSDGRR